MTRARLNELIDIRIMGGTGVNPPDYVASRQAFQPVVDKLKSDHNWALRLWVDRVFGTSTNQPSQSTVASFHRSYVVRITREAAHQSLVEARGEVSAGENTYERVVTQVSAARLLGAIKEDENDLTPLLLDSAPKVGAAAALLAIKRGFRPATRLRDL